MRYRQIDVKIWGDEKFRALSPLQPSGQAVFFYLLTNLNTNSIPGLFRAGLAAMAEELGWEVEAFQKGFQEVSARGMAEGDFKARVILIPNAIRYNKPQSPNVVISWEMHWDEIPECELKNKAYQLLKDYVEGLGESYAKAFHKAIRKPIGKTMSNQEQEQEQILTSLREVVVSEADSLPPKEKNMQPKCPHQEIIALYHNHLSMLPKVMSWTKTRESNLRQRWRENPKHQELEFWRKYFEHVAQSRFLTGQVQGRDGQPPFIADLEWLIRPTNFTKVIEGKYHRE